MTVQPYTAATGSSRLQMTAHIGLIIGLISNDNKTEYRDKVAQLAQWCQDDSLAVHFSKTKEFVVHFRNHKGPHCLISLDGT